MSDSPVSTRGVPKQYRINAKILTGIQQLDRGEGIPEHQLDDHLAKSKSKPK